MRFSHFLSLMNASWLLTGAGVLAVIGLGGCSGAATKSSAIVVGGAARVTAASQPIGKRDEVVPYAELLTSYPEDWPQLSRRLTSSAEETDRKIRGILAEDVDEFSCDREGLEKVKDDLARRMGINILTNYETLKPFKIDRDTPLSLHLKHVSYKEVLTSILKQAGGKTVTLGFTVDDGVLTISTKEEAQSADHRTIKVYDIRDFLLAADTNQQPPIIIFGPATTTGPSSNSVSGTPSAGTTQDSDCARAQHREEDRDAEVKAVIDAITSSVEPESWRDNGGTVGSLKGLNGQLIVNQTVENQYAISELLQQLRQGQRLQISIEETLLTVDEATFQAMQNVYVSRTKESLPPGFSPAEWKTTDQFQRYDCVLSGEEFDAVLKVISAAPLSRQVAAPRLFIFNGQKGHVTIVSKQTEGATTHINDPDRAKEEPRVNVECDSAVMADHRYVVVKPDITGLQFQRVEEARVPIVSPGPKLEAQKLVLTQLSRSNSMLAVPDDGACLVGVARVPSVMADGHAAPGEDRYVLLLVHAKIVIRPAGTDGNK